jgi:hypothetical protein
MAQATSRGLSRRARAEFETSSVRPVTLLRSFMLFQSTQKRGGSAHALTSSHSESDSTLRHKDDTLSIVTHNYESIEHMSRHIQA